eukprot:scaffold305710_cov30-Tisochrysis_lutea.AAC.4
MDPAAYGDARAGTDSLNAEVTNKGIFRAVDAETANCCPQVCLCPLAPTTRPTTLSTRYNGTQARRCRHQRHRSDSV